MFQEQKSYKAIITAVRLHKLFNILNRVIGQAWVIMAMLQLLRGALTTGTIKNIPFLLCRLRICFGKMSFQILCRHLPDLPMRRKNSFIIGNDIAGGIIV